MNHQAPGGAESPPEKETPEVPGTDVQEMGAVDAGPRTGLHQKRRSQRGSLGLLAGVSKPWPWSTGHRP